MDIKQVATELKIAQTAAKKLSMEVLGSIPVDFTSEQFEQLKTACIAATGRDSTEVLSLAATIQRQVEPVNGSIEASPVNGLYQNYKDLANDPQKLSNVKQILGKGVITKNFQHYHLMLAAQFNESLALQRKLAMAYRIESARIVDDTFQEMRDDLKDAMRANHDHLMNSILGDTQAQIDVLERIMSEGLETNPESKYNKLIDDAIERLINLG